MCVVSTEDKTRRIPTCTCHIPHPSLNFMSRRAQLWNYSTLRIGGSYP